MPLVTFAVSGQGTGVAQTVAVDGADYTIQTDAYEAFGGKDEHPSPLAYTLGRRGFWDLDARMLCFKQMYGGYPGGFREKRQPQETTLLLGRTGGPMQPQLDYAIRRMGRHRHRSFPGFPA